MATTPVKSQPLHNFSSSFLRWGTTAHAGTVIHRSSPDSDAAPGPLRSVRVGSRSARSHRFSSSSNQRTQHRHETAVDKVGEATPSKRGWFGGLSSKLSGKAVVVKKEDEGAEAEEDAEEEEEEEEEDDSHKPWNLRPRKPETAGIVLALEKQTDGSPAAAPKSIRLRGSAENGVGFEKKEKMRFWIALSKEEIEEDIFIMTGSRPARRPRKRPKNVQKQLDTGFPGLWLVGSTADAFRIPHAPLQR